MRSRDAVVCAWLLTACAAGPSDATSTLASDGATPGLAEAAPRLGVVSDVDQAMEEVSAARIRRDVDRLAAFGTRHTLSATEGERGIGAARRWLRDELASIADESGRTGAEAMTVRFDPHRQPKGERIPREVEIVNVEAVLPGSMPAAAARRIVFVAHYDSRPGDPLDAEGEAPGANDDGSGTAALLELARVLSRRRFDATIVLLAVAGEEQGLHGARAYAHAAKAAGADIAAVVSNDIVGDPSNPAGPPARDAIRVFSEGLPRTARPDEIRALAALGAEADGPSRQLARFVAEVAELRGTAVRPRLVFRNDRFLRGGDHTAFLEQGFPAVRMTEPVEKFDRQHQDVRVVDGRRTGDLPEFVDEDYLADVARLDLAVLWHLSNAPSPPRNARIVAASLAHDTTLRWTRSPEPDVAGYEVVVRATTSPVWESATDVGDAAEATLPVSKDEHHFGVRAYDREGLRSVVAFPSAAKE
jgi:hypothetical protein